MATTTDTSPSYIISSLFLRSSDGALARLISVAPQMVKAPQGFNPKWVKQHLLEAACPESRLARHRKRFA
eukprot:3723819-Heterocapsa_arctica.AAC.1